MAIGKILNHWSLLTINILLIFSVELTGRFFADTGLIHLIAIVFVILALVRAAIHPHVYDRFLEPIIHRGIFAMLVFATSHVVEYAGFMIYFLPRAAISANVVNFYLASILIVITGVEVFVGKLDKFSHRTIKPLEIIAGFFVLLILYTLSHTRSINLSPSSIQTYAYLTAILTVVFFSLWRLMVLKNRVPLMTNFVKYFMAAFILVGLSALFYILEGILTISGISFLQLIYFNHFLFYGALSLIFLAYDRLLHLGGLYNDIEKMKLS